MTAVDRQARWLLGGVTAVAGLFCAAVAMVPVAEQHAWPAAPWLRLAFRPLCHQITGRCLDLGAGPLAVCARCSGLWAGGVLGLSLTTIGGRSCRPRLVWIAAAAIPSIIDFGLGLLGLPTLSNWPRFGIALGPGLLLGLLLAGAIIELAAARDEGPTDRRIT